ncbi:GDSL-type esterase/lipase family protein [Streptomyces sp. 4F14]|uniref:SGNH/GDSL hydrolase family protein n=1 Tax=Streptomyces sp. 4F14 TaxID=3394380 RepID=UPI003A868570
MRRRTWAFALLAALLLVPQSAVRAGVHAPSAPPVPLESHFDNRGISADAHPAAADLDGKGASLPASALAAAGWTPGRALTVHGTRLTWPATAPGSPDNVLADGQRVTVSGRGDALTFLVTSTAGHTARGTGEITYADGTRARYGLAAPDWRRGSLATKAVALPHVNTPAGRRTARARVYAATVPLDPARPVTSVRLPVASGHSGLHVFALAVRANPLPWTGTWATAHSGLPAEGPWTDRTLRLVVHASTGGTRVRLRFDNTFAGTPVRIGAATVALRAESGRARETTAAGAAPGDSPRPPGPTPPVTAPPDPARPPGAAPDPAAPDAAPSSAGAAAGGVPVPVSFGGAAGVEIPAGTSAVSDPIGLTVPAGADLLVSFHLPGTVTALPTHRFASQRSYVSAPGDHTADRAGAAYASVITGWPLLAGVDVAGGPGSVVLLGDSITDGYLSTTDANRRWPDVLAARLRGQRAVPAYGVLNAGIAGNRVAADGYAGDGVSPASSGVSALARLERDVFAQPSVRTVVVFEGINDLLRGGTSDDVTDGLREIAERAGARGVRVLGATLLPCAGDRRCTPRVQERREKVNAWIRDGDAFDAVLDFDAALRDPAAPSRLLPAYDSGDRLHPSDAGYAALAGAVDLREL